MTAASAARTHARRENLETVLSSMRAQAQRAHADGGVSIGELLDAAGRRSYGPLLLVIGLFAISPATLIPGMTWLAAAVTFLIAGQMVLGLKKPWLPKGLRDRRVPADKVVSGVGKTIPWAQRIDKFLKPRLEFLAKPPFANLVALACIAAALITIPLSFIPLAPALPSLAIVIFGLGMTARDGVLLAIGLAISGFAGAWVWALLF